MGQWADAARGPLRGNGQALRFVTSIDPLPGVLRLNGMTWLQDRPTAGALANNYAPMAACQSGRQRWGGAIAGAGRTERPRTV